MQQRDFFGGEQYICVVGGANIDISGKARTKISTFDSNPGRVSVSLGGVGRNIAENLARLGNRAVMLTVLADDINSGLLRQNAREVGIDFSHSLVVEGASSTTYLCLTDSGGEMFVGLSDMELLEKLTPEFLQGKIDVINGGKCVVCDTNVPKCLKFLQKNATTPLFLDTVSAKKTQLIKEDLSNVFCAKPNIFEAEVLAGFEIKCRADIERAIFVIHNKGVKWVVVTCGGDGVYFSNGQGVGHFPTLCSEVKNTTGGGDSFLAGLVHGFLRGFDLMQCVKIGSVASKITLESEDTVSKEMCLSRLDRELKAI